MFSYFSKFFLIKGFFKKEKIFLYQFNRKYAIFKFLNLKIAYFVKEFFESYFTNLYIKNFVFLEDIHSDFYFDNYSKLEQLLNWKTIPTYRVVTEEGKIENFFATFTNLIIHLNLI